MPLIKVSYSDLEDAFLFASYEQHCWLDKLTGRILSYGDDAELAVEEGDLEDLPDWMEHEVKAAREVLGAFGELPGQEAMGQNAEPDRYVSIEQIESHEAFQFMEDFIGELNDKRAREGLSRALAGPKPFRRFRNTLNSFPIARERWFEYEAKRRREYIEQWALEEGVELDFAARAP